MPALSAARGPGLEPGPAVEERRAGRSGDLERHRKAVSGLEGDHDTLTLAVRSRAGACLARTPSRPGRGGAPRPPAVRARRPRTARPALGPGPTRREAAHRLDAGPQGVGLLRLCGSPAVDPPPLVPAPGTLPARSPPTDRPCPARTTLPRSRAGRGGRAVRSHGTAPLPVEPDPPVQLPGNGAKSGGAPPVHGRSGDRAHLRRPRPGPPPESAVTGRIDTLPVAAGVLRQRSRASRPRARAAESAGRDSWSSHVPRTA